MKALCSKMIRYVLIPFSISINVLAAELGAPALITSPQTGIKVTLVLDADDGEPTDWKLLYAPKLAARHHDLLEGASFETPWNAKTKVGVSVLQPEKTSTNRAEYFLPVPEAKDWLSIYVFRAVKGERGTVPVDASVAWLARHMGDVTMLAAAKNAYFAQGASPEPVNEAWCLGIERAYKMKDTQTTVIEVDIEPFRKPAKPVEILAWGDNHMKLANDEDRKSDNIMAAFARRGNANPPDKGTQSLEREMEIAPLYDAYSILGDNVDFFSYGSYELWKRMCLDVDRGALVVLGYHDYVTHTINRRPQSEMPMSVTLPVVKKYMPNDITYATKLVGNVLMVGLDASRNGNYYWEDKIHEKLAADVKLARERGWTIIIFQHEGMYLNTWMDDIEADKKANLRHTMTGEREMNYFGYSSLLRDSKKNGYSQTRGTKAVYRIIWDNADVIRGVFHGHVHANYASWIQAKTPSGESKPIPQYSCCGSVFFDNGFVFLIKVK